MRPALALTAAAVIALVTTSAPVLAKKDKFGGSPAHADKMTKSKSVHGPAGQVWLPVFTASDHSIVRAHFAEKQVVWTGLPPGIAKNYARGKPLPPGIAKKMLPPELLARLPEREGYEYARVGTDVVLIEIATRVVVDVIQNIFG